MPQVAPPPAQPQVEPQLDRDTAKNDFSLSSTHDHGKSKPHEATPSAQPQPKNSFDPLEYVLGKRTTHQKAPRRVLPQARGGYGWFWIMKKFTILSLVGVFFMLLWEASAYHPPSAVNTKPHSLRWLKGSAVLPAVPARCPDHTIASLAGCAIPQFMNSNEFRSYNRNLTVWADRLEEDISNAELATLNLLPGRRIIVPRLRDLQRHANFVSTRSQEARDAFYLCQGNTLHAINKAFADLGQTYFVDPNSTPRFLCAIGLCDKVRDNQRLKLAKILWAFTDETIAAVETLLYGPWVMPLDAEIVAFDQTIKN
ncbi:hypothetical protein M3J09_013832 [Ascochyta lentis]